MNPTIHPGEYHAGIVKPTQKTRTYVVPVGMITTKTLACEMIKSLLHNNKATDILLIHTNLVEINKQKSSLLEFGVEEPPIVMEDGASLHLQMLVAVNKANMEDKHIVFLAGHTEHAMVCWIRKHLLVWFPDLKCTVCKIHDDTPFLKSSLIRMKNFFVRLGGFKKYRSVWRK